MTHILINKCAKNYYNRTFIVQVIAKNVVTCFFLRHSVDIKYRRADAVLKEDDITAACQSSQTNL